MRGQVVGGEVASGGLTNRASAGHNSIVMHQKHAIGGASHVEFDAVRSHLTGAPERSNGVLALGTRRPTVGQHLDDHYFSQSRSLPLICFRDGQHQFFTQWTHS